MRTTPNKGAAVRRSWDRLQELLVELKTGDTITLGSVTTATGLESESVEVVLRGLTRAGLFEQRNDTTYVRDTLLKPLTDREIA